MKLYWIAAGAALLCAACATTGTQNTQVAAAEEQVKTNAQGEELICEYQKVLGSLRRIEVCKTQAQIEAENAAVGVNPAAHHGGGAQGQVTRNTGKAF